MNPTPSAELFRPFAKETENTAEIQLKLEGVRCVGCLNIIEKRVAKIPGIIDIRLNLTNAQAHFVWDKRETGLEAILAAVKAAGFECDPIQGNAKNDKAEASHQRRLKKLITALFLTMNLMLISVSLWAGFFTGMEERFLKLFQFLSLVLATPVIFYSGSDFIRGSYFALKNRRLNMDFQIAFNATLIYFYSIYLMWGGASETYFEAAAMFVTFILTGKYFESAALRKMSSLLKMLNLKYPQFGRLMENGVSGTIPIEEIKAGMELELLPGDAIPADGKIISGTAGIDESSLTGEYLPRYKKSGERLYSGTFVSDGKIIYRAEKEAGKSTLCQLSEMLEKALSEKITDQGAENFFHRHFTNLTALLSVLTFFGWYWISSDWNQALLNAVAVFIIACPCALALATPLACLSGFRLGSRNRILMKSAKNFNSLHGITDIVFDKTGTLTEGRPKIVDFFSEREDMNEVLYFFVSNSRHPISRAVNNFLKKPHESATVTLTKFNEASGRGLSAVWNGRFLISGSRKFMEENQCVFTPEMKFFFEKRPEATLFFFAVDRQVIKAFIVEDTLRKEAVAICRKLVQPGMRVHLCSGDGKGAVKNFVKKTGLFEYSHYAEMTPADKKALIERFQKENKKVLFVGDGLNDSPAMAQADLSISMNGGIDLAIKNADIVLLENNLNSLPKLFKISEKVLRLIKVNLLISVCYNASVLPLAVLGFVIPPVAAASMALSSLIVVGNSLRFGKNFSGNLSWK